MKKYLKDDWFLCLVFLVIGIVVVRDATSNKRNEPQITSEKKQIDHWITPSLFSDYTIKGEQRKMVMYGEDLIANTSKYFGPHGSVNQISNGMNCQNCHLSAGTRPWGNNYSAVASTYPRFRERSGTVESISKRVNDCIERSLNGRAIDTSGYEMKSIIAYIQWLGKDVKKGVKPQGAGIVDLPYLDRPANAANGQIVYSQKCQSCHTANGQGLKSLDGISYFYPPLWGDHSYNTGAGLYRLSRFAGYVRDNMPFDKSSHQSPALTSEEAWDVAAFVNTQPRPKADLAKDWPNIAAKPIDHPFGPYADGFSEEQHKYGPFKPIVAKRNEMKKTAPRLN
ncbi:MAG: c-type cytochrome [Bacteroidota bacterium]